MESTLTQTRPDAFACVSFGVDSGASSESPGRRPEVEAVLARLRSFDPSTDASGWNASEAGEVLIEIELMERRSLAFKAQLVSCLNAGRHTTTRLVELTGIRRGDAQQLASVARVCDTVEDVVPRLRSGQLSASHVASLARLTPESANLLLDLAAVEDADTFKQTVARRQLEDCADLPSKQRHSRRLNFRTDDNGCTAFSGVLPPLEGAEFRGLVTHITNRNYYNNERSETDGTREQRDADSLVELVRLAIRGSMQSEVALEKSEVENPATGGPVEAPMQVRASRSTKAKSRSKRGTIRHARSRGRPRPLPARPAVVVTVNPETLAAEIVGGPPLDREQLAEAIARSDLYVMLTDGTDPVRLNFDRSRRAANHLQYLALAAAEKQCLINGCHAAADQCQVHHIIEYDEGGATNIKLLVLLCSKHHHHLHLHELKIVKHPDGTFTVENKEPDPF